MTLRNLNASIEIEEADSPEAACEITYDTLGYAIEHYDGFPSYHWRDTDTGEWYVTTITVTIEEVTDAGTIMELEEDFQEAETDWWPEPEQRHEAQGEDDRCEHGNAGCDRCGVADRVGDSKFCAECREEEEN